MPVSADTLVERGQSVLHPQQIGSDGANANAAVRAEIGKSKTRSPVLRLIKAHWR
jgi:hypothetical protein